MIRSFRPETEKLFRNQVSKKFRGVERIARRKLQMLNAAMSIEDLRSPPGNRLEALVGDRRGQYSVRINQQFRICFNWIDGASENVEIVEYH
jgi:toxin HigB-1